MSSRQTGDRKLPFRIYLEHSPARNLASLRQHRKRMSRAAPLAWPSLEIVRRACDEFVELRRERGKGGEIKVIAACATIGRYSVLVLIHCRAGGGQKKCTIEAARRRSMEFRKSQHLIQLARRFKQPIVVCVVDPPVSGKASTARWYEPFEVPKHLLSQWTLDVPVVLLVLASKVSCGIFGVWLPDKSVALAHTKFLVEPGKQSRHRSCEVEAKQLVHSGILDGTIAASPHSTAPQMKLMQHRLRNALIQLLDEVAECSPQELMARRQNKLERVEAMAANLSDN